MAMLTCPFCSALFRPDPAGPRDAAVCPECGERVPLGQTGPNPHLAPPPPEHRPNAASRNAMLIEQTAKRYKASILKAAAFTVIAAVLAFAFLGIAAATECNDWIIGTGICSIACLGGMIWFIIARTIAWWHHG